PGELTQKEDVSRMIGRKVDTRYVRANQRADSGVLDVADRHCLRDGDGPGTIQVLGGEVVSLVALMDAHRNEITPTIYGADQRASGTILVDGRPADIASPGDAISFSVGMVPESRKEQALFPAMDVTDNITIASLDQHTRAGVLARRRIQDAARQSIARFGIRLRSPRQEVRTLSGGNQQKVVLSRWLATNPRVLILDEPTRGVDVGAKQEIYRIINEQAEQGMAVLIVS